MIENIPETAATEDWQILGGSLNIPDGYFVTSVNCDYEEPFIEICKENSFETERLPVPKALAYYLSTQGWASNRLWSIAVNSGIQRCQKAVKSLLGIFDHE